MGYFSFDIAPKEWNKISKEIINIESINRNQIDYSEPHHPKEKSPFAIHDITSCLHRKNMMKRHMHIGSHGKKHRKEHTDGESWERTHEQLW